jgi:hypothetical protein
MTNATIGQVAKIASTVMLGLALSGYALAETTPPPQPQAFDTPSATAPATDAKPPLFKPDWDQAANIKEAAERLGKLHRQRGPKAAIQFIDACYRTNGLAEAYNERFEACIAQDYMETQILAQVYSRLPDEQLKTMGAPTAQGLADGLGKRVVAAFSQYKISAEYAGSFKVLVDKHGFPVFLPIVFPKTGKPGADKTDPKSDLSNKPDQR